MYRVYGNSCATCDTSDLVASAAAGHSNLSGSAVLASPTVNTRDAMNCVREMLNRTVDTSVQVSRHSAGEAARKQPPLGGSAGRIFEWVQVLSDFASVCVLCYYVLAFNVDNICDHNNLITNLTRVIDMFWKRVAV